MSELSTETLVASASVLREGIGLKKGELAALTEDLRRAERELQLLTELIRNRGHAIPETDPALSLPVIEGRQDGVVGQEHRLAEAAVEVLRLHGKPMQIQELTAAVHKAGIVIPGRGEPANLIAHIRSHPEVVRPVRGVYGLREWGLNEVAPVRRRRRVSRRSAKRKKGPARRQQPSLASLTTTRDRIT